MQNILPFSSFSIVSLHHEWKETRLLSPETNVRNVWLVDKGLKADEISKLGADISLASKNENLSSHLKNEKI